MDGRRRFSTYKPFPPANYFVPMFTLLLQFFCFTVIAFIHFGINVESNVPSTSGHSDNRTEKFPHDVLTTEPSFTTSKVPNPSGHFDNRNETVPHGVSTTEPSPTTSKKPNSKWSEKNIPC